MKSKQFAVKYKQYIHIAQESGDEYDRDCYDTTVTILGWVDELPEDYQYSRYNYEVMYPAFTPVDNAEYYLVYAIYESGDSLGYDTGLFDIIHVYENKHVAEKVVKMLKEWTENDTSDEFSINIPTENGKEFLYCVPWKGYFERLSALCIEPITKCKSCTIYERIK